MSDLVKRLRDVSLTSFPADIGAITDDAADLIEHLERELRVYMDAAEGHMVERMRATDELAAEKALADSLAEILKNCDVSTGYCCCGDSVDHHGMGSGHSPVDEGAYHSEKALEAYRKARGL